MNQGSAQVSRRSTQARTVSNVRIAPAERES